MEKQITQEHLSQIMEKYTASYNAMMARSAAAKADVAGSTEILTPQEDRQEWFSKWEATRPQGTYGTWNISDRD